MKFLPRDCVCCHVPKYWHSLLTEDFSDLAVTKAVPVSWGWVRFLGLRGGVCFKCGGKYSRFCFWTRSQSCLASGWLVRRSVCGWGDDPTPTGPTPVALSLFPPTEAIFCYYNCGIWGSWSSGGGFMPLPCIPRTENAMHCAVAACFS